MIVIKELKLFDSKSYQNKNPIYELKHRIDRKLIKSKERVHEHGEVFTPEWMVKKMLSVPEIKEKINTLHATFFEPSAGEGAFLTEILHQKLCYVDKISKKKNWEINALWALASIYAIEYLEDNLIKSRQLMIDVLIDHYQSFFQKKLSGNTDFFKSAILIIKLNIVQGNTLTCKTMSDDLIVFNEWKVISNNEVLRIPFTYKSMCNRGKQEQLDIFASSQQLELFNEDEYHAKKFKKVKLIKVHKEELE